MNARRLSELRTREARMRRHDLVWLAGQHYDTEHGWNRDEWAQCFAQRKYFRGSELGYRPVRVPRRFWRLLGRFV